MSARDATDPDASSTLDVLALEAVVRVAEEYDLPRERMKPCIAYHLDGNLPDGIPRHKVAFTLAMELRELTQSDEAKMRFALARWAAKVGYPTRRAVRAIRSALAKRPSGEPRWRPPGLVKKAGGPYEEALAHICVAVGCPANCPCHRHGYVGMPSETFEKFEKLGWVDYFERRRQRAAIAVYRAISKREKTIGFSPGARLYVSYIELAKLARYDKRTIARELRRLSELGLITFVAGSGAGLNAAGREASEITRTTPIPTPEVGDATQVVTRHNHWVASRGEHMGGARTEPE